MTVLSAREVAIVAYNAGFRGANLSEAVAHAYAESRFNTMAFNPTFATYGLWQIEGSHVANPSSLYYPQTNANVAYRLWLTSGWEPWSGDGWRQYAALGDQAAANASSAAPHYTDVVAYVGSQRVEAISVPVERDGQTDYVTYLLWTSLKLLGFRNYVYLHNAAFRIDGKVVQGIDYQGSTYLPWSDLPGVSAYSRQQGGFRFARSGPGQYVPIAAVGALMVAKASMT
ncbi:MAG: hypothetical protein OWT27_10305 [Firmicutes bacterium]|nr:hypothetical protein [Bacillota bacterium]